ncbi:MAG: hypothetical protein HC837_01270 [Chloroflexaceae bacterium]|nr:hypothetical protein [Chloroflexaceae bacterium]
MRRVQSLAMALASVELWMAGGAVALSVVSERFLPWTLVILSLFWPIRWLAAGKLSRRTPIDWCLGVLVLILPITLAITTQPEITSTQVYRLLSGIGLYYAMVNHTTSLKQRWLLPGGMILVGALLAVSALVTIDWQLWGLDANTLLPTAFLAALPLLVSDSVNPNVMAGNLILVLPLALACLLFLWQHITWFWRGVLAAWALMMIMVIGLTQSAGALAALGCAVSVLVLFRWHRVWVLILPMFIVLIVAVSLVGVNRILDERTAESRIAYWSRAVSMIEDAPLTGIGMGTYKTVLRQHYPFTRDNIPPAWANQRRPEAYLHAGANHSHNLLLQIAVDLGLPGLIAWLAAFLLVLVAAWQLYWHGWATNQVWWSALGAGLFACHIALMTHGLIDSVTWGMIRPAVLVWGMWGLTIASWQLAGSPLLFQPPAYRQLAG